MQRRRGGDGGAETEKRRRRGGDGEEETECRIPGFARARPSRFDWHDRLSGRGLTRTRADRGSGGAVAAEGRRETDTNTERHGHGETRTRRDTYTERHVHGETRTWTRTRRDTDTEALAPQRGLEARREGGRNTYGGGDGEKRGRRRRDTDTETKSSTPCQGTGRETRQAHPSPLSRSGA